MKKLLLALVLLSACTSEQTEDAEISLLERNGRWAVVNYWAQWCKPCIQEIPELNELAEQYPEVEVFGINYDGITGEELQTQAAELGIRFHLLQEDPAALLGVPRPVVLPTTLILDPTGNLAGTLLGPQTLATLAQATKQLPAAN